MPNPMLGMLGASIGGSVLQGQAAKSAAGDASAAQVAAAQMSVAEQRRQFNQMRKLLQPYVGAGNTALTAQLDLLGMGGGYARQRAMQNLRRSEAFQGYGDARRDKAMEQLLNSDKFKALGQKPAEGGTWGSVGGVLGDKTQTIGANGYTAEQQAMIDKLEGSARYKGFGADKRQAALAELRNDPRFNNQTRQQRAINQIRQGPQFQTMVEAGENAILGNASVTGGLRGGNTQRALAEFRPQVLNQLIGQQLGNLGGLVSMGQSSAAGVGNAGMQMGANIGNTYGQMGAAQAGAALAAGQANANMFGGIAGSIGNVMGQMMPAGGMPAGSGLFDSWVF